MAIRAATAVASDGGRRAHRDLATFALTPPGQTESKIEISSRYITSPLQLGALSLGSRPPSTRTLPPSQLAAHAESSCALAALTDHMGEPDHSHRITSNNSCTNAHAPMNSRTCHNACRVFSCVSNNGRYATRYKVTWPGTVFPRQLTRFKFNNSSHHRTAQPCTRRSDPGTSNWE